MNRLVTLYTIQEQQVMAYDTVSFFRQHNFDPNATLLNDDLTLATTERLDVPVRRFCEQVRRYGEHSEYDIELKEYFIAIDPKLQWMIEEPVLKRVDEMHHQVKLHQQRIWDYNNLPWYKRIFKKV